MKNEAPMRLRYRDDFGQGRVDGAINHTFRE